MLKRQQPSLHAGLLQGHESISEGKAPGGLLNGLWASVASTTRGYKKCYEAWLEGVDRELADLRGFAPSVSIRFADYPVIEYSLDWAQAYLERPEHIDEEGVWHYRTTRSAYLLEKPRQITISLLCPDGGNFTYKYFPSEALKQAKRDYAACIRRSAKGHPDETFLSKAAEFIDATTTVRRFRASSLLTG